MCPRLGTSSRRMTSTAMDGLLVASGVGRGVGQQRDRARLLDSHGEPPLVARAGAGDPCRDDLAPLAQEGPERPGVLVVDEHGLVGAEATDLAAAHAAPSRRAGG